MEVRELAAVYNFPGDGDGGRMGRSLCRAEGAEGTRARLGTGGVEAGAEMDR